MLSRTRTIALVASITLLAGCVLGERRPTLYYPPKTDSGVVATASAAAKPAPKSIQIVLISFADHRSDKKTVGTTRNAFGMKMADVTPLNSVPDWVMQAIKTELQNNGYSTTMETAVDEGKMKKTSSKGEYPLIRANIGAESISAQRRSFLAR